MNRAHHITLGAALFAGMLSACGDDVVGSRYLASAEISPAGGRLAVSSDERPDLAATRLDVPAGALEKTVTITLEPSTDIGFDAEETAAGPAVDFGPDGLAFETAATMTLPVSKTLGADEELRIHVLESDGTRSVIEGEALSYDAAKGTVSFAVEHFTRYQPGSRQRPQCRADADCPNGDWCVNGACTTPTPGQCRSANDCAPTESCIQGSCQVPNLPSCQTDADCSRGESCVSGQCQPQSGCSTDADCPSNEVCELAICVPACVSNSDCNPAETCNNGHCIQGNCLTDSDCAQGEVCISNQCTPQGACGLSVQVRQVGFGTVTVGQSSSQTVQVQNTANSADQIVALTLNAGSGFTARPASGVSLPVNIAAGSSELIEVEFSPTANGSHGDVLLIESSPACNPVPVALAGTGTGGNGGGGMQTPCQTAADCARGQQCVSGFCQ